MMDNTAIARIANRDLSEDTLALLHEYGGNDDVVFFLGRLVWQGQMTACVAPLRDIACDPSRGRYARIVSIRSVMTLGDAQQKDALWNAIAGQRGPLDRQVLGELLEWAEPTLRSVDLLLQAVERLAPHERFDATGLEREMIGFIDRLPLMVDNQKDQPLGRLISGFADFLGREPFVEQRESRVSVEFAWLMGPAVHAVDRLVAARSALALSPAALEILRSVHTLRHSAQGIAGDYKSSLSANVPRWRELNDLLYWTTITEERARLADKGHTLVNDWQISFRGNFWKFGPADFERCLDWVRTKTDPDDRLVALSRSISLYVGSDRPATWLGLLRTTVAGDPKLEVVLEGSLESKPTPVMQEAEDQHRAWKREQEARDREEQQGRADWVRELKANPDRVRHPPGLTAGDFSGDQYHLLLSTMRDRSTGDRNEASDWLALVPEFGEPVARAYRDAAVAHWRVYTPGLGSEGVNLRSTPYSLVFAMAGLAIEAEDSAFAERLTPDEARHAFRYVIWQLNGFPSWFEPLYRAHPAIGLQMVEKELIWELEYTAAEPLHYLLHDVLYHAPWLQAAVAPAILNWLHEHETPSSDALRYSLDIMTGGGVAPDALARLASNKARRDGPTQQKPRWFALWIDTDPEAAIPALEEKLAELAPKDATEFAQRLVVGLLGERHGSGARVGAYRNARHLKALYILMHRYIRVADDIERAGKGVYSPTLRDDAQRARDVLFNLLASTPGPEAYAAIKALEKEHPEPGYRRWMALRAYERATADADEPLWTVEQVKAFAAGLG